jgi:Zn-dependent peptidase ImmA (M78 family)
MKNTVSRATLAARRLLSDNNIVAIPTPLERLAKQAGATLAFEPFEGDVSGLLYRDDTKVVIGVNANDAARRQRFTIAHELGHLLLHADRPMFVDKHIRLSFRDGTSSLGTNAEEIEANAFAAELLMPATLVEQEVDRYSRTVKVLSPEQTIRHLARTFDVSPQAMEIRLTSLGYLSPT